MVPEDREIKYSVPVPAELDQRVREAMEDEGYSTVTEYVRAAIRAKLQVSARRKLEAKLGRAMDRGRYREASKFWEELRKDVDESPKG